MGFDNDRDGLTDAGELISLAEAGVGAIDLQGNPINSVEQSVGNRVYNHASVQRTNGTSFTMLDTGLVFLPDVAAPDTDSGEGSGPAAGAIAFKVASFDRKRANTGFPPAIAR